MADPLARSAAPGFQAENAEHVEPRQEPARPLAPDGFQADDGEHAGSEPEEPTPGFS